MNIMAAALFRLLLLPKISRSRPWPAKGADAALCVGAAAMPATHAYTCLQHMAWPLSGPLRPAPWTGIPLFSAAGLPATPFG